MPEVLPENEKVSSSPPWLQDKMNAFSLKNKFRAKYQVTEIVIKRQMLMYKTDLSIVIKPTDSVISRNLAKPNCKSMWTDESSKTKHFGSPSRHFCPLSFFLFLLAKIFWIYHSSMWHQVFLHLESSPGLTRFQVTSFSFHNSFWSWHWQNQTAPTWMDGFVRIPLFGSEDSWSCKVKSTVFHHCPNLRPVTVGDVEQFYRMSCGLWFEALLSVTQPGNCTSSWIRTARRLVQR